MNDSLLQSSFESRCQTVLQVARQLLQGNPDWVTFFREVLGIEGAARRCFPEQDDYVGFEKSDEYAEIQQMVTALRQRKVPGGGGANETTRVITVRLPESLHEALKHEASDHNTSMNKLCISKLLQVLSGEEQPVTLPMVKRTAHSHSQPHSGQPATPGPARHPVPGVSSSMPAASAPPAVAPAIGRYSNL